VERARSLKENAAMHQRMADRAADSGMAAAAAVYRQTAEQRLAEAGRVQQIIAQRAPAVDGPPQNEPEN
jgi:hypothetical protein